MLQTAGPSIGSGAGVRLIGIWANCGPEAAATQTFAVSARKVEPWGKAGAAEAGASAWSRIDASSASVPTASNAP